ncbi:MAG: ComF family protein [Thermoleophilia bacterium]
MRGPSPIDVILPPSCAACGLPGGAACAECLALLRPLCPPHCEGCGMPVPVPVERCPACRGPLAGARQAVAYDEVARGLVAGLKDGRRRGLAEVLAERMAACLPPPPPGALLVPVPLGPRRMRERGFNQSLLLARALSRRWGRDVAEALVRVREGAGQRGSGAAARERQVAGAFAARGDAAPETAWLVDDVHTTGATLAACARALRAGGSTGVGAACFARALAGRGGP